MLRTLALLAIVACASASPAMGARSVSYADRTTDADFSAHIAPGTVLTVDRQCGHGWFTEFSAYRADGAAIGAQRVERFADGTMKRVLWQYGRHNVTFDGVTFRNHTRHAVRVAGWCS